MVFFFFFFFFFFFCFCFCLFVCFLFVCFLLLFFLKSNCAHVNWQMSSYLIHELHQTPSWAQKRQNCDSSFSYLIMIRKEVHKKSSNFSSRLELGTERILNFITCQALKFSKRLNKLPATHFLKEVCEVDKSLHHEDYKSWYYFIQYSMHNLNVSETNLDCRDVSHNISKKYCSDIYKKKNILTSNRGLSAKLA